MDKIFREYTDEDYLSCEEMVNRAWGFDKIFPHQGLSDLAKCVYTKGSVLSSNYKIVVEVGGEVVGFIFGLNEKSRKPGRNILFGLSILWKLMRIDAKSTDKKELMDAIKVHEKNRADIVARGRSEIVLFVVSSQHQGKGFGKELWAGFKAWCAESGVSSIIVETNKLDAGSFYENLGFTHFSDFDSPLHELSTKDGQACVYEYSYQ